MYFYFCKRKILCVLMQPIDASNAKSKLRKLPPKEEVKTGSFQGIQLKPVTKEPKEAQQAQKNGVELKVVPLKGIKKLAVISMSLFLSFSLSLFMCF